MTEFLHRSLVFHLKLSGVCEQCSLRGNSSEAPAWTRYTNASITRVPSSREFMEYLLFLFLHYRICFQSGDHVGAVHTCWLLGVRHCSASPWGHEITCLLNDVWLFPMLRTSTNPLTLEYSHKVIETTLTESVFISVIWTMWPVSELVDAWPSDFLWVINMISRQSTEGRGRLVYPR